MKRDVTVILLCFAASAIGANVQPLLTGAGKLLFPENAVPASISASSGQINVASGGSNQNVVLTPSGTGYGAIGPLFFGAWPTLPADFFIQNSALSASTAGNYALAQLPAGDTVLNAPAGHSVFINNNNTQKYVFSASGLAVQQTSASFALDTLGDTNTSGVFRQGGTAGISGTATFAGGSLTLSGGIVTASSNSAAGITGSMAVRNSAGTGSCTITLSGGLVTGTGGC